MTLQSYPNGNPPNSPIMVKATLTGNKTNGVSEYVLTLASDGSTLVASSYRPLADACRALRAAGESNSANVTILLPLVGGGFAQGPSGGIGYGLS
jgi:hypothetical protein